MWDAVLGAGQHVAFNCGPIHASAIASPQAGRVGGRKRGPFGDAPRTRSLEEWRGKGCARPHAASSDRVATRPLRPKLAPAGSGRTPQTRTGSALTRRANIGSTVASRQRAPAPRCADPCSVLRRAVCVVPSLANAPRTRSRAAWCGKGRQAAYGCDNIWGLMRLLPQTGLRLTRRSRAILAAPRSWQPSCFGRNASRGYY